VFLVARITPSKTKPIRRHVKGNVRMEIQKRIERNPIIYLLISAISVSAVAVGVAEYFCRQRMDIANQKSELRISTLEGELTSIRRGLGESKYLDIRTFVFSKDRFAVFRASPKTKYIPADNFYAIVDLPGWQYKSTSFGTLVREEFGDELSPAAAKVLGKNRVYYWKATEGLTVTGAGDYSKSGPNIFMQRYPTARAAGVSNEDYAKFMKEMAGVDLKPKDLADSSDLKGYHADMAAFQLATLMQLHLGDFVGTPDSDTQLIELEKVANVIYLQLLVTVRQASVNGKKLSVFFVREEQIIISDQEAVTQIVITVPSADPAPRGPVYTQIQEWFSGLAIQVD
jgi:hypothetical protein